MFHRLRRRARRLGHVFHRGGPAPGPARRSDFGVKRPLRFLVERLQLDADQTAAVARAFQSLRLERAQAALDADRARARVADLLEAEALDGGALGEAADQRVTGARRERDAWVSALSAIHAVLRPDQRRILATTLRTGVLAI